MATNMYKKYTEAKTREWAVPTGTQAGDLVVHEVSGQIGVALTARGDSTAPANVPGITGGTVPNGGAGNKPTGATVAVDGSWIFTITGAVEGETVAGTGTPAGTAVYLGDTAQEVTLTGDPETDTLVGVVDDGAIIGGRGPILIGAVL